MTALPTTGGEKAEGTVAARGDATREKLIATTIRLVGEIGYARTTTRAIAQAAGVAEGTLYRHFPDKAGLFAAAVFRQHAAVIEWVEQLPARAGHGTVTDNLADCLTRLATLRESILPLELALMSDPELSRAAPPPGELPGPPGHLADYIAAEQALGRIRPELDPHRTALILLATLFGLIAPPRAAGNGTGTPFPTLAEAVETIVKGIAGR